MDKGAAFRQMVDYRNKEVQDRYLAADFAYRTGVLTKQEFYSAVLEILFIYLEWYQTIQPYYQELQRLADQQWEKAKNKAHVEFKNNEPVPAGPLFENIKRLFLLQDLSYRKGITKPFQYAQVIASLLIDLVNRFEALQPYLKELEAASDQQWQNYQNTSTSSTETKILTNKKIENEKESLFGKTPGLQRSNK